METRTKSRELCSTKAAMSFIDLEVFGTKESSVTLCQHQNAYGSQVSHLPSFSGQQCNSVRSLHAAGRFREREMSRSANSPNQHKSKRHVGVTVQPRRFCPSSDPQPKDYLLYYGFSTFAMELNELNPDLKPLLPRTDTRLRPDQRSEVASVA